MPKPAIATSVIISSSSRLYRASRICEAELVACVCGQGHLLVKPLDLGWDLGGDRVTTDTTDGGEV